MKRCSKNKAALDFGNTEPTLRRYLAKSPDEFPIRCGQSRAVFSDEIQMAGVDWLAGFRERHKDLLSLCTPEMTSLRRIQGFNEAQVLKSFSVYLESSMRSMT